MQPLVCCLRASGRAGCGRCEVGADAGVWLYMSQSEGLPGAELRSLDVWPSIGPVSVPYVRYFQTLTWTWGRTMYRTIWWIMNALMLLFGRSTVTMRLSPRYRPFL